MTNKTVKELVERADAIYERCKMWPERTADGTMALIEFRNFYKDQLRHTLTQQAAENEVLRGALEEALSWPSIRAAINGHALECRLDAALTGGGPTAQTTATNPVEKDEI